MSQKARPIADVNNQNWTPSTNLYETVDEPTPSDADYAYADLPPGGSFTVQLASLKFPGRDKDQKLTARLRIDGDCALAVVDLLKGNSLVATRACKPNSGFIDYVTELTGAEIQTIDDFGALKVRVTASGCTGCCKGGMATITIAGVTDGTCSCGGLNGDWTLMYESEGATWWHLKPHVISCIGNISVTLSMHCNGIYMDLDIYLGPDALATYRADLSSWNCKGTNTINLLTLHSPAWCQNLPSALARRTSNTCSSKTNARSSAPAGPSRSSGPRRHRGWTGRRMRLARLGGLSLAQVDSEAFTYIEHPQWLHRQCAR